MVDRGKRNAGEPLREFEIIARHFAPLATESAALGLRDDAAVLVVPESRELIVSCDTLIEGVHFFADDPPRSIGHKALAVNLSDITAKGARGFAYLLALAVSPNTSDAWFEEFAAGLRELQEATGIALVGGDTTASPGPLTITVTALGLVAHGHAVLRHGAKGGDRLYVSGTIGDAYLGLRLLKEPSIERVWGLSEDEAAFLVDRYRRPSPRTDLVLPLRNFAQSAIDVSDGLVLDIEKLAHVSHVGARVEAPRVPVSTPAQKVLAREPGLLTAMLTAGDDYEIVAAVPEISARDFEAEAQARKAEVTMIGRIEAEGEKVVVNGEDGRPLDFDRKGFSHF